MVNQWLSRQENLQYAWVSLDDRDNEPTRFFHYLIIGLQSILPELGNEALDLLQLPGLNWKNSLL